MDTIWTDRKRHFGLPISFTKYSLSEDRLFRETGLLNLNEEEVLLYRVRDVSLSRSLWQRIFGVGTITVHSSDKTSPTLEVINVKDSKSVKELIFTNVEKAKEERRMRATELLDDGAEDSDFEVE
ncbi:PH domain-containing protein [Intestinimonas sp.]|mgnify:FL=1|uniref:PH domain-containing protein n=1 Tax=Intestinimonas sp. TaxID=1965293 RepID=UPI00262F6343|nr:PH domain-containing protein [Intestinimonas sp.]